MTSKSKMNVYHPAVVADMKRRGLAPVKEVEARKQWGALHKSISELATKVKLEEERPPGKRYVALFNGRRPDFGQTPWHQKPEPLFKERK